MLLTLWKCLFFVTINMYCVGVMSTGIREMESRPLSSTQEPTSEISYKIHVHKVTVELETDTKQIDYINKLVEIYRADKGRFPGYDKGEMPEEGEEISYAVYKELLDDMYIEESVLDSTGKNLDLFSKRTNADITMIYNSEIQGYLLQIPQNDEMLMEAYEALDEQYKKWIVIGE